MHAGFKIQHAISQPGGLLKIAINVAPRGYGDERGLDKCQSRAVPQCGVGAQRRNFGGALSAATCIYPTVNGTPVKPSPGKDQPPGNLANPGFAQMRTREKDGVLRAPQRRRSAVRTVVGLYANKPLCLKPSQFR